MQLFCFLCQHHYGLWPLKVNFTSWVKGGLRVIIFPVNKLHSTWKPVVFSFTSTQLSLVVMCNLIHLIHPSIHPSIRPSIHPSRLTQWPYLLQHIHCVPAALQSGGEAGCCRGIVILSCLREKLGHRYLIRHPLTGGKNAHRRVGDECSERQNHVRLKNKNKKTGEEAGGVSCAPMEGKAVIFFS